MQYFKPKVLILGLYILVIIIVFVGCLDSFSRTIYLNIPAQLGGGNPIKVNLIFKASDRELSLLEKEMDLSFERKPQAAQDKKSDETDSYFVTAFLITETEEGFYLKAENNKVVYLQRETVLHLTYYGTAF